MAFELDPVFHTETMVKILKEQGHLNLAANILEKVLEKSPENPRMLSLRESLKNGGRDLIDRSAKSDSAALEEDETTDPGTRVDILQSEGLASSPPSAKPLEPPPHRAVGADGVDSPPLAADPGSRACPEMHTIDSASLESGAFSEEEEKSRREKLEKLNALLQKVQERS